MAAFAVLVGVLGACGDEPVHVQGSVCGQAVDVTIDGGVVEVAGPPGEWRLAWHPEDGEDLTSTAGPLPLLTTDTEDDAARITTPDGACTALVGRDPSSRSFRVVGDSLVFQVARFGDAPDDSTWQGTPGAAYGPVADDPLPQAIDEVRGAVADGPDALVLVYGANDALWSAQDSRRRSQVRDAVTAVLAEAAAIPCVRVVTPSAGPTVIFGLGDRYTAEAEAVARLLRDLAPPGSIVDWTAASAEHHLPDGTDGDWFLDGDEIHPNEAGRGALVALVEEAVAAC